MGETSKPTNKCYCFVIKKGTHSNSHKSSEKDSYVPSHGVMEALGWSFVNSSWCQIVKISSKNTLVWSRANIVTPREFGLIKYIY